MSAPLTTPFNIDAATSTAGDLLRLEPRGNPEFTAFTGRAIGDDQWHDPGARVLMGGRGCGKSHLLLARSAQHRQSVIATGTVFYPDGGRPRLLVEAMGVVSAEIPSWLLGRNAVDAWVSVWQLSIVGLLVWWMGADVRAVEAFGDWFGDLERLDRDRSLPGQPGQPR